MSIEFFTRLPLHGETQFLPGDPRNRGDWHAGGASTGAVSGFAVGDHFRSRGIAQGDPPFLDIVPLRLSFAEPEGHYHVPLLCTPWSYSTYRGS